MRLAIAVVFAAAIPAVVIAQENGTSENQTNEESQSSEDVENEPTNEAVERLTEQIEADPSNARLYVLRGTNYFTELNQKEKALADLNRAIELFREQGNEDQIGSLDRLIGQIQAEIDAENAGEEVNVFDVVARSEGPFVEGDTNSRGETYVRLNEEVTEILYPTGVRLIVDKVNNTVTYMLADGSEAQVGDSVDLGSDKIIVLTDLSPEPPESDGFSNPAEFGMFEPETQTFIPLEESMEMHQRAQEQLRNQEDADEFPQSE